jgi:hypothetical protein
MRLVHTLHAASLCGLLLCGSALAFGGDKAPPQWATDAAKVATPAYAKDAAAVTLYHEDVITLDAQNRGIERERTVVRILKPQGRRAAECYASYDVDSRLKSFHAWTFLGSGKILQAKDENFTDYGAGGDVMLLTERARVLKAPGADPGAVVACETEVQLRSYINQATIFLQDDIPTVFNAFEVDLPPGGHYSESWRKHDPVKPAEVGSNQLRWEFRDTPALDLENLRAVPHWGALASRMTVMWGTEAVKGNDAQWRAIGQWTGQLQEHRTDPTPEITAKAQQLTAGAPDLYTKLQRITDYVQKNVRYFIVEKGIGGWQSHYAGDIYRNRFGDCKDKTTLLISLLKAANINAYFMFVDHRRGIVDPDAPSMMGDHMITAIELPENENDPRLIARVKAANGKSLLIFDPTDEATPVGLVRSDLQGGYGGLANGDFSQVIRIPILPPDAEGLSRTGAFELAADGSLSGQITDRFLGDDAQNERYLLKETDARELRETLERSIAVELPGLALKDFKFTGAADLDKPLNLEMKLAASGYSHASGPLLLLKPRVFGPRCVIVPEVMQGKPRLYPIELGHPGRWHDAYDIAIPAGYAVDELPDPISVDVDFASYHSTVKAEAGKLHYESEYVVRDVEIPAAKANELRKLAAAMLADEKATAVLKKQ